MKRNKIILLLCLSFFIQNANARENIKELFKNNQAIIYTINIRNFGSTDKDNDGIINPKKGDIRGSFLNAKENLKKLSDDGINTIYVLPITPVGKYKALGTAGSLYAMDSFNTINPQIDDTNPMNAKDEAKLFTKKAHELNMNVILDLPSCGSYDLSLKKPDWFMFDENGESLTPADWTDVRLFKIYNEDKTLNEEVLNNFKSFVDMALELGFDGIRADVAAIKPYEFWKNIIDYAKSKDPNFYFLAEANPEWGNPANNGVKNYATIDSLLKAGFDSYYGSFSDFKNIKTKKEFDKKITTNLKILQKHKNKSIIGAFATHDQQAPILRGKNYWNMILWLNVTLPLNSYFLDGFSVGDDFTYDYENEKAKNSLTDDEFYYVHSGMIDIFNMTASVRKLHPEFEQEYKKAISFKNNNKEFFKYAKYKTLKTGNERVFAYSMTYLNKKIIVVASLDEDNIQKTSLDENYLNKNHTFEILNNGTSLKIEKDKMNITLEPLELAVYSIETK